MPGTAVIETLEDRRLLSATPLAAKSSFPSMLGTFTGTLTYFGGVQYNVTLNIKKQHGAFFTGTYAESSGLTARVNGSVNRSDHVRFVETGTGKRHFSSVLVGTLSTDTLNATFKKSQFGLRFHGGLNVTRPSTTAT